MKRKIIYGLGALLIATVTLGAVANGPYYALPAWAQKLACAASSNCPRFIVLADWNSEAVLDRETGLVWERSPSTTAFTWIDARNQCASRTTGERKGWRLPSVHELGSLIDPTHSDPALSSGHPFLTVQSSIYWSATISADPTRGPAWGVLFSDGQVGDGLKSPSNLIWCVRGNMDADQY